MLMQIKKSLRAKPIAAALAGRLQMANSKLTPHVLEKRLVARTLLGVEAIASWWEAVATSNKLLVTRNFLGSY